jgi:hypothetical protein
MVQKIFKLNQAQNNLRVNKKVQFILRAEELNFLLTYKK